MDEFEAVGKMLRLFAFPFLLWNLPMVRAHYFHEWDYVLFLLRSNGMEDLARELIKEDEEFYFLLMDNVRMDEGLTNFHVCLIILF